jgi:rRNA-processing protein FCF1
MNVVAMDTSALMLPIESDVRVFEEIERLVGEVDLVAPEAVFEELRKLADGGSGREAMAASVGLDLATERCRIVESDESYADDALVDLAAGGSVDCVVTNDSPLRTRLLAADVPVIHIRGRNKLAITQP